MSDVLPQIEPETSGQVTQWDVGHSNDIASEVALGLTIGLFIGGIWTVVNLRKGTLKNKLKSPFSNFRSLFKNEWIWRFFLVLQIIGFVGITYLAITDDNNWHLFPYSHWNGVPDWDFFNSQFWAEFHENWFVTAFLVGPFLISKATDWIIAAKKTTPLRNSWKNN
jgi:hypothetical protein